VSFDPANFGELARRSAVLYPAKLVMEQDDLEVTYGELERRTQQVAALLTGLGIVPGERVLVLLANDFRFAEILLGTLRAGAIAVPVNIKLGADQLAYIADHSESVAAIGHREFLDKIPPREHTLVVGEDYDEKLTTAETAFETVAVDEADEALLMYTSGSTGAPKGVQLSHANKWWQARSSAETMMWKPSDKGLVTGPLYHANALWACLLPMLYVGGSLAILPGFDPEGVLAAIDRYRPTYTSGTPAMFSLLLAQREALERYDVSSIELLECGSAPVPEELMTAIKDTFGCEVCETYGLTEGGANVISPRWGVKKLGSTGLPVPGVEIRIVDPEGGRECEPGEVGELWSRSGANAIGYLKQPEVTAEKFTEDGWLKTGDLVKADEQGYVFFCGRVDDMISVGGENVYPKEVETILLAHPQVDDVCVVPASHAVKGRAPVAWVVTRAADSVTEDELKQWFLERGPAYAHPRRVFFVDELPVSGTNKLDRKRLEEDARRALPDGVGAGRA
jgi:acyl-CoA synthetase (AMP-forming)/AMP-acid ligase II